MRNALLLSFMLFSMVVGCDEGSENVATTGMITYLSMEGGFYGIITDNGDRYLPENLHTEFQRDSLRVYFEGVVTDRPSTQQWGRTIALSHIDKFQ